MTPAPATKSSGTHAPATQSPATQSPATNAPAPASTGTRLRRVVTPEGVPLNFEIAGLGERIGAFLIDGFIVVALIVGAVLLDVLTAFSALDLLADVVLAIFVFGLRFFYFIGFELRWQGRTPGKRMLGLRVIDRNGGPLLPDAVIARNLTREVEFWVPLACLFLSTFIWPAAPGWFTLVAILWLGIVAFMPIFNKDRMRVGDLIAGTIVVSAPQALLLRDLAAASEKKSESQYTFTREQLDMYGIYELQVLERLLRGRANANKATLESVCEKIKKKIAWDRARWKVKTRRFLEDFYRAQRGRLEHRMLYGDRRERKQQGQLEEK